MAVQGVTTIKATFETGDRPTQQQFIDLIDTAVVSGSVSAGAAGAKVLTAITTASAQQAAGLSVGAVGLIVVQAGTTASARSNLGVGAVGSIQLDQATTASAQTVVGGGVAGRTVFQASTTASARQGLDLAAVTTAQMSAPTNTSSAFVTPALQHYHPLHPKAMIEFNGEGASAFQSWNVGAVAKIGDGHWRLTWGSAFATKNYGVVLGGLHGVGDTRATPALMTSAGAKSASEAQINITNAAGALVDASGICALVLDR